ncbi:hypothetical protein ACFPIF_19550, partial [Brevundimonas faecalis]|uniref:hypothetical protein n=1 Tax=Brevundimonas faecalis TaxID=947378 RepID=UPI00361EA3AB
MTKDPARMSVPVEPEGVEIDGYALSQYGASAFKIASDQGLNHHGAINAAYREMVRKAASTAAPVTEEGGAVERQALERIGNRDMRRELGAGDYGVDRTRCPSCGHAWDDGKPEHHAEECALIIARAALATRSDDKPGGAVWRPVSEHDGSEESVLA